MIKYLNIFILLASGLLITLVSAFFSIKGFTLFLPDKELLYGILGIGVGFELAKVVLSTFLFHRMKDSNFPILIKLVMGISVIMLILFSSIFTFVHLNATASQDLATSTIQDAQVSRLLERNDVLQTRIEEINSEIAQINASDKPNTKLRVYNALSPEKEKLESELSENSFTINNMEINTIENSQYTILESISEFTNHDKKDIFTYIVLFIVIIIDPLAITLFLAGSYILAEPKKNTSIKNKESTLLRLKKLISKNTDIMPFIPLNNFPLKPNYRGTYFLPDINFSNVTKHSSRSRSNTVKKSPPEILESNTDTSLKQTVLPKNNTVQQFTPKNNPIEFKVTSLKIQKQK